MQILSRFALFVFVLCLFVCHVPSGVKASPDEIEEITPSRPMNKHLQPVVTEERTTIKRTLSFSGASGEEALLSLSLVNGEEPDDVDGRLKMPRFPRILPAKQLEEGELKTTWMSKFSDWGRSSLERFSGVIQGVKVPDFLLKLPVGDVKATIGRCRHAVRDALPEGGEELALRFIATYGVSQVFSSTLQILSLLPGFEVFVILGAWESLGHLLPASQPTRLHAD